MLRRSRELFADILRQTDLVLLALCAAASLFGVLMVASATRYMHTWRLVAVQSVALLLGVVLVYLIMVAQFQSLLSPFIIMFCIPLAFTGGFIALFITGNELGIISMLGFIMLAGLIVNNGIVLIDYINQARREGMSKHEAIIDAGRTRLRPILMTAMTTILAMFTSAIGIGDGSDMIRPMAIAIIGGLLYGTILRLLVIPCIYDAFNREKSMVEEEL